MWGNVLRTERQSLREPICYPYICTDSRRLVNHSHKNRLISCLFTTWSLRGFISCNSDNCVQKVIIIGNTCILWHTAILHVVFRLTLALYTLFLHENSVQSYVFSICKLRPIRLIALKIPLVKDNFMEMSKLR